MTRLALPFVLAASVLAARAAEPAADSPAAAYARGIQLKAKVSTSQKDVPLIDFLKDLAAEAEKRSVRTPRWTYSADVSKTLAVTYSCKDKPLEQVLNEAFKAHGLGYVVVSADGEKLDGFIRVTKGSERGYAAGAAPPAGADDKQAAAKVAAAKDLLADGKALVAKAVLRQVVKDFPGTASAKEAAKLLEGLDK